MSDCYVEPNLRRLKDRAELYGVQYDRALFLVACPHGESGKSECNRTNVIPYDPAVQIKEASRLGIGLEDAAFMMETTPHEVLSYGFPFNEFSTYPRNSMSGPYNLFLYEPINPDVCFR